MINTDRLCLGCMNDNGGEKVCPICGYEAGKNNPENCLPVKFIVKDRYLVGKAFSQNGAEIAYTGWDNANDSIVKIKEYFPNVCSHRNPDKTVSMVKGEEYAFNEGLLEFAEINRVIMASELPSLVPVIDVFEENGTIYAVESAVSGITLENFLEKNGGTLKWEQARALFLPLIDTVKGMNDAGILHRAISSKTIIVGRDGKLRISDYCIKNLRMTDEKLDTNIYAGYAAVEQYGFEGMHDDCYTDVYGLCSTIFRVLIGVPPTEACIRLQNDVMSIPAKFAEELPRHVLAALANGLQVLPNNRTKDIETFKNELVYGEINNSTVTKRPRKESSEEVGKIKSSTKGSSAKYVMISMLCTALVFLGIATILIFTVFKEQVFKPDDANSSNGQSSVEAPVVESIGTIDSGAEVTAKLYSVPDLKGKYYAEIIDDNKYEMFDFVISGKAFSDQYPKGTICAQSVEANSDVVRDTKIELTISLGSKEIKIANLKGLSEAEAKMELLKQGFIYDNIEVLEKYDEDFESGVVLDQEPKYGSSVNTEVKVKIYINSYKPEETENSSSEQ